MDTLDLGDGDVADSIVKVIGVGGGDGNAISHMHEEGIHNVVFVLCSTDVQALNDSPVPVHLQLDKEGSDTGNHPGRARRAAEKTIEDIKHMFNDGTKMIFITAGMGGGMGTGAAPVIARVDKELGILTVGIVTVPFHLEGAKKIDQALDGVEGMVKYIDALLIINNEHLCKIYPGLSLLNGFRKADDTLGVATKSTTKIIAVYDIMNLDFSDVKTILRDGDVTTMSTGYGKGRSHMKQATEDTLNSPLPNDNNVYRSKKILLSINFNTDDKDSLGLTMEEMGDMTESMNHFSIDFGSKWGLAIDPELDKKVKIIILATGFGIEDIDGIGSHIRKQTQEDAARQAEEKEKATECHDRRDCFHKGNNSSQYKHRPHTYRFTADELGNEDVILAVENTPTCKRTKQMTKDTRRTSNPERDNEENESNEGAVEDVVSFV